MAKPTAVLWPRARHTEAKHQLLIGYLKAWIGILGSWAEHVLLVDGFAGPGAYLGDEPGSPILMLDALLDRPDRTSLTPTFHFLFVEQHSERCKHLAALVDMRRPLRERIEVDVAAGDFATVFPGKLEALRSRLGEVPPTFAFIDPFGAGDDVVELTSDLVRLPRCEALIYVPVSHLARFVDSPDLTPTLDRLYGGRSWMPARQVADLAARKQILQDAFIARLRASCRYVRPFEIVPDVGKNSYVLFFGTSNDLGLRRMKDAMWKLDPAGGASFRDSSTVDHPVLFQAAPDLAQLEAQLRKEFTTEPFAIERAADFTLKKTAFRDNGHLKPALKLAEAEGRLVLVRHGAKRRRGQFPHGTVMRFVE